MNQSDCPSEQDLLLAFRTRQAAVTAHGRECRRCGRALADLAAVEALLTEHAPVIFASDSPDPRGRVIRPVAKVAAILLLVAGGLAARGVLAPIEQIPPRALRGAADVQRILGEARLSEDGLEFRLLVRPDGADTYEVRVWSNNGGVPERFESPDNPVRVPREALGGIARGGAVLWQMRAWKDHRVVVESAPRELILGELDDDGAR